MMEFIGGILFSCVIALWILAARLGDIRDDIHAISTELTKTRKIGETNEN